MTEQEWLASEDPAAMLARLQAPLMMYFGDQCFHQSDRKLRLFACTCARAIDLFAKDDGSARLAVAIAERFAEGYKEKTRMAKFGRSPEGTTSLYKYAALGYYCCRPEGSESALLMVRCEEGPPLPVRAALLRDIVGNPYRPMKLPKGDGRWKRRCQCDFNKVRVGADNVVTCPRCHTPLDWITEPCPWLTPLVVSLAQAAYDERSRVCEKCKGTRWRRYTRNDYPEDGRHPRVKRPRIRVPCEPCHGTGRIDDGTLAPDRLAVLADALEEAGCDDEAILMHLRVPAKVRRNIRVNDGHPTPIIAYDEAPHVAGCWVLDLLLGLE